MYTNNHNHTASASGQTHKYAGEAGTPRSRARTRFNNLLLRAGMTRAELERVTKVHRNTVCNWSRGGPLPGAVEAYLELRARVLGLLKETKTDE